MHPDGNGLSRLTAVDGYAGSPDWSADGKRIVFYNERSQTWDHGNNAQGLWSPDGKRIVFTSTSGGWKDEKRLPSNDGQSNGEPTIMQSDGTHPRQLTDDQWEQAAIAWLKPGSVN